MYVCICAIRLPWLVPCFVSLSNRHDTKLALVCNFKLQRPISTLKLVWEKFVRYVATELAYEPSVRRLKAFHNSLKIQLKCVLR